MLGLLFRIGVYCMFAVGAAPLEAYAYFFNGIGNHDPELRNYPWSHGLLYVIAILLFAETIFRTTHTWHIAKDSFILVMNLGISILISFGLFLWYFGTERIRISNIVTKGDSIVDSSGMYQNYFLGIALLCSIISFALIEWHKWSEERAKHEADRNKEKSEEDMKKRDAAARETVSA